jgi:hypothetical protein
VAGAATRRGRGDDQLGCGTSVEEPVRSKIDSDRGPACPIPGSYTATLPIGESTEDIERYGLVTALSSRFVPVATPASSGGHDDGPVRPLP